MKSTKLVMISLVVFALTTGSFAHAADECRGKALSAAENDYDNDPVRTLVKTITPGKRYKVTVGIGNAEDGAYTYIVSFPNGCDSVPTLFNLTAHQNQQP